jgi:hypothetical protein
MPKEPLDLLDSLGSLGFNDEAFWRLHHSRLAGRRENIAQFRRYCRETDEFQFYDNNASVQQRLAFVLNTYRAWKLPAGATRVFEALADAAFLGIHPVAAGPIEKHLADAAYALSGEFNSHR